jgi:hypothetical protein
MKVLEIGPNRTPKAQAIFPEADIETMDINPEVKATYTCDSRYMPKELYNRFDAVVASHILEHIPFWETNNALEEWGKVLKGGGMLHVFVPSLEWVATQVLSEKMSRAVLPHLHGGLVTRWDIHLASFTMRTLRANLESSGYGVVHAQTMPLPIMIAGEPMKSEEHYVIAQKKVSGAPRKRHKEK